jgi:PmbA protein
MRVLIDLIKRACCSAWVEVCVNGVTGDYSRGATGFWIEGGEIAYPVHEVTIAGNLRNLFAGLQAIGSDVDARGGVRVGSIWVGEFTIAGE